jgi:hypothetical protein
MMVCGFFKIKVNICPCLEVVTYGCFEKVMQRMSGNFPNGTGMSTNLANMRSLIQVFSSGDHNFTRILMTISR